MAFLVLINDDEKREKKFIKNLLKAPLGASSSSSFANYIQTSVDLESWCENYFMSLKLAVWEEGNYFSITKLWRWKSKTIFLSVFRVSRWFNRIIGKRFSSALELKPFITWFDILNFINVLLTISNINAFKRVKVSSSEWKLEVKRGRKIRELMKNILSLTCALKNWCRIHSTYLRWCIWLMFHWAPLVIHWVKNLTVHNSLHSR